MNWNRWIYGKRYMQLRTDGEREAFKRGSREGVSAIAKPIAVQLVLSAAVSAAAVIGLDFWNRLGRGLRLVPLGRPSSRFRST